MQRGYACGVQLIRHNIAHAYHIYRLIPRAGRKSVGIVIGVFGHIGFGGVGVHYKHLRFIALFHFEGKRGVKQLLYINAHARAVFNVYVII